RHVAVAGEVAATVLRGVDDQGQVPVVPVRRLLVLRVGVGVNILAGGVRVEGRMERVLGDPALEAGPGPGGALEERRLVVAGPGVAAGPRLADVAGEHE